MRSPAWLGSGSPADRQTPWARSGWERKGAQSRQGGVELILPGPAQGDMQGKEVALRVSSPAREKQGLGGGHRLAQADEGHPASSAKGG